jgi:hypothetical protein
MRRARRPPRQLMAIVTMIVIVSACTSGAPSAGSPTPADAGARSATPSTPGSPTAPGSPVASVAPSSSSATSDASPSFPTAPALTQPWATATLTDVETGESFRIADLAGRTVFVETMAIWCTNCRRQQGEFRSALERLDPDRVAYVVLTVDPGETSDALARYESDQGFHGRYAVAGRDVSAALEADFGATVLNPPSVPIIIIRPDGTVTFDGGPHSADDIVALATGRT